MRIFVTLSLLFLGALFAQGCVWTGAASQTGPSLITSVKEGGSATAEPDASRMGKACSYNMFGLATIGDSSVDKAKIDGDVQSVSSVDREYLNILFLWGRACTIVRGK